MNATILSNIANLSYENEDTFRSKITIYTQPNNIHFFDASVNGFSDAQMYTLEYDNVIVFSIRGTSTLHDLITDIYTHKKLFHDIQFCNYVDQQKYKNMRVHSGFLQQYNTVKFNILAHIFKRLWADQTKQLHIILTSHSLGAGIAVLVAATLKAHFGEKVYIENWLFGCPRVGNNTFMNFYNDNIDKTFLYVCKNDIVTKIPKIGYSHFKNKIILGDPTKASFCSRIFGTINDHFMDNYITHINQNTIYNIYHSNNILLDNNNNLIISD
jgi:hypothetical protein